MNGVAVVIGDVVAWVLFVGIGVLGLASSVAATLLAYRFLRGRGGSTGMALAVAGVVAFVTFLGLWIVADLYWLIRQSARLVHGSSVNPV